MPKKIRVLAHKIGFAMALSQSTVFCLNSTTTNVSTKFVSTVLNNLKLRSPKTVIVYSEKKSLMSYRNLDSIRTAHVDYISPYEMSMNRIILFV